MAQRPPGARVVLLTAPDLLYQAWTYYVFRQRISPGDFQPPRLLRGPGTHPAGALPAGQPIPNAQKPAQ